MSDGGAIAVGVLGAGVAVLAVNYAMSAPGESWLAKIEEALKPDSKDPVLSPSKERARKEVSKRLQGQAQRGRATVPTAPSSQPQAMPAQRRGPPPPRSQWQQPPPQQHPQADSTVTNLVSKTFGGPPSSPVTKPGGADKGVQDAQKMLNTFFQGHVIDEDGKIGPHTIDAIKQFQAAQKLPVTGIIDGTTHDFLVQISTPLPVSQTKVGEAPYSHLIEHADRSIPDWWGAAREFGSYWLLPPPISYARQMAQAHAVEDSRTHTGYWAGAAGGDWKAETAPLGKAAQDVLSHAISEGDPKTLRALSKALSAAGFPSAASAMGGSGHDSGGRRGGVRVWSL